MSEYYIAGFILTSVILLMIVVNRRDRVQCTDIFWTLFVGIFWPVLIALFAINVMSFMLDSIMKADK